MTRRRGRPAGFSLVDVMMVLAVIATLCGLAVPRFMGLQHRLAARGAASVLTRALLDARHAAWRLGVRAAVRVDTGVATVTVFTASDTLAVYELHALFGVTVQATRDSLAYQPSGLGYGAANARFIVTHAGAAETVTVSRVGRVRR